MPDVMPVLKAEIIRLARKEINEELASIKRVNAAQRGYIAGLRRDIEELSKQVGCLQRTLGKAQSVEDDKEVSGWISGKGICSIRSRLDITQEALASLAGVSHQSIVRWEQAKGKISFKSEKTLVVLKKIKSMSKADAWAKLGKE